MLAGQIQRDAAVGAEAEVKDMSRVVRTATRRSGAGRVVCAVSEGEAEGRREVEDAEKMRWKGAGCCVKFLPPKRLPSMRGKNLEMAGASSQARTSRLQHQLRTGMRVPFSPPHHELGGDCSRSSSQFPLPSPA